MTVRATGARAGRIALILAVAVGAAAVLVGFLIGSPTSAHAKRGLELGVADPIYESSSASTRNTWLNRTKSARAGVVVLVANWRAIAPTPRPATFNPSNPADPAYSWGSLDASVRDARAHGLKILMLVNLSLIHI